MRWNTLVRALASAAPRASTKTINPRLTQPCPALAQTHVSYKVALRRALSRLSTSLAKSVSGETPRLRRRVATALCGQAQRRVGQLQRHRHAGRPLKHRAHGVTGQPGKPAGQQLGRLPDSVTTRGPAPSAVTSATARSTRSARGITPAGGTGRTHGGRSGPLARLRSHSTLTIIAVSPTSPHRDPPP